MKVDHLEAHVAAGLDPGEKLGQKVYAPDLVTLVAEFEITEISKNHYFLGQIFQPDE